MKRSWLIQRLTKPRGAWGTKVSEAFAFGGGLRNGGLTEDGMASLREIFNFDYMGASEFEWGAVPKALQAMASTAKRLRASSLEVTASHKDWRDKATTTATATVYVVCGGDVTDEVHARITEWASKPYHELKEQPFLTRSLCLVDEPVQGWLELDNGFAFFADRDMWLRFCDLFGVKVQVTR